jgi:hypothetical protein
MKDWTGINYKKTVALAAELGIDTDAMPNEQALAEEIMLHLMKVIRNPSFVQSAVYDEAVEFYLTCHNAIMQDLASNYHDKACVVSAVDVAAVLRDQFNGVCNRQLDLNRFLMSRYDITDSTARRAIKRAVSLNLIKERQAAGKTKYISIGENLIPSVSCRGANHG